MNMKKFANNLLSKELSSVWVSILILPITIVILNLFLMQFPLTNVLGYEFSALNSVLLIILSGLFTINWLRKNQSFSKSFFICLIIFFLIPLFINIAFSLFTEFCSFSEGIMFYSSITITALPIGVALGLLSFYSTKRFNVLIFMFLILCIAVIPVAEIYFYPQIYFYNPLVGYFPGSIYDEGLTVDLKLITYRIINVIYSLIIIYLILSDKLFKRKLRNSIIVLATAIAFILISPFLGYSTNYSRLNDLLPVKFDSPRFLLHLPENISEKETKLLALHTQFYYEGLEKSIKEAPSDKIEIFLFENSEQKKHYFGSGSADVAKPWLYQIYLSRQTWQSTLKHELAHIFSAEFGSTIFKLAGGLNPFLIEGFATAHDPFREDLSVDYLAALALSEVDPLDIDKLLSGFNFFLSSSSFTYTYAGSFTKYLIENFGIEQFKKLYSTNDFTKSYGLSSKRIVNDHINYLKTIPLELNIHEYHYHFGRLSIVQKFCPRYIGKSLQNGWEQVWSGNLDNAKKIFRSVLSKTPNYSALVGLAECLEKQDSINLAIGIYNTFGSQFEGTPYHYLLTLRLADLYAKTTNNSEALKLVERLHQEKPSIYLDIISSLRLRLFHHNTLKSYVTSDDSGKFQILKDINKNEYFFPSIPLMINLAEVTGVDYENFINEFHKTIFITDFYSAYAVYKLSNYMLMNFDFRNARKMAALAKRYRNRQHLNLLWQDNFEKAEWFYYNADEFLQQFNNAITQ